MPNAATRTVQAGLSGIILSAIVLVVLVLVPVSVRHSAPFGSVQTVDFSRSIAVMGGEITPNYPGFDRVDLDLRAYGDGAPDDRYDFVLRLQTVDEPRVIRRVAFSVAADRIPATRSAFAPISTAVEFDPIADSAGQTYYVSIERGARNADDIVTLWGIRSYSTVSVPDVLLAAMEGYRLGFSPGTDRKVILAAAFLTILAGSVSAAAVAGATWPARSQPVGGRDRPASRP